MKRRGRIITIVLDSVGIGELPDAAQFEDVGAHTLGNIGKSQGGLHLPRLKKMGLGNIESVEGVDPVNTPTAYYGKMQEISRGKDTSTGHWELMGIYTDKPFQTYPQGFPPALIKQLEEKTGRKVLANRPASGTQIIEEWGEEHLHTGSLIVYTSADSVMQIAAHDQVVPLDELYRICEIARELTLADEFRVVRVIARPFTGEPGYFERTSKRRDYSVEPPEKTVLDHLVSADVPVTSIGKISDIFAGRGISESIHTVSNEDGIAQTIQAMKHIKEGFIFVNLVDFDSKYGHRRDPAGYKQALEVFDSALPDIVDALAEDDLLMITADHGNDPTFSGTDHTREYVPLLVYSKHLQGGQSLGIRQTFADMGATIADWFQITQPQIGNSFLDELYKKN